ncbi:L-amino acid N-acyltransferase YncA [Paenibacillus sp. BK033]|uniref:GNAT family N-acetyltransferase n=1 Tax=Paenibacillus sp. BK033 TaxID=2512133 RepID=UPI00104700DA|nr:GNAT family N-acetyltransferase [Paenibacillus sp. BK033]TCM92847.1 L-amino acid N-acyltransferase YncA [Paenibacillus sp. BK033]
MRLNIRFVPVEPADLDTVQDIVNSNTAYNLMENGRPERSREELLEQLSPDQHSLLIRLDGRAIGLLQYLDENPKDGYPWLGLLMIHDRLKGKGYGKAAYASYEQRLKQEGKQSVRIGVIPENEPAKRFWGSLGFQYYATKLANIGIEVDCYEKAL